MLDTPFGTAQLNPSRFYDTVVKAAVGLGCELVLGSPVEEVLWDGTRAVGTWWLPQHRQLALALGLAQHPRRRMYAT